jgi:hypothetical protein
VPHTPQVHTVFADNSCRSKPLPRRGPAEGGRFRQLLNNKRHAGRMTPRWKFCRSKPLPRRGPAGGGRFPHDFCNE